MDWMEPYRVAKAVKSMGIKHAVITSVNRDEQKDSGMKIWADTVYQIRKAAPEVTMETLIPDVKSRWDMLKLITDAKPDVISHNMETVKRLYRRVRPQAKYERSLEQIKRTKAEGVRTKSGFMVGLGETVEEVYELMRDLHAHDCDVLTIGQYFNQPKCIFRFMNLFTLIYLLIIEKWALKWGLIMWKVGLWCVPAIIQKDIWRKPVD